MSQNFCSFCNGDIVYNSKTSEYCCSQCGLITGSEYQEIQERAFTSEEVNKRSFHGEPVYIPVIQIGSELPYYPLKDHNNNPLSKFQRSQFSRLLKTQQRSFDYKQHILKAAWREMERIRSHLDLPRNISEYAMRVYKEAMDLNAGKGKSVEALGAAAIIIASRKNKKIAITSREIINVANASGKQIRACVRLIQTHCKLKHTQVDLSHLCFNISERLGLTMNTRQVALKILKSTQTTGLAIGKQPASVVAAVVYIATIKTGERRTQKQIAKAAFTTPMTVRSRYKEIVETLQLKDVYPSRGVGAKAKYM